MSEFGVPHYTDDVILTAAQLNAGQRRMSRELQTMLQHWLFGDAAPSAGAGGVMGGLVVDNVTGQMQLTVSPGSAFYYDAGVASPLSPFKLILHPSADIVNVSAADATHDSIDVVSIKAPTGTDTEETCLVYEAASDTYATQRWAQPVVTVTAGTPAASPSAPATPAGELKLAEVRVPAAASNLNAATITDFRSLSGGFVPRDGSGTVPLRTAREWWEVAGWAGAYNTPLPANWQVYGPTSWANALLGHGLTVENVGASSGEVALVIPLPLQLRGQSIIGGRISYEVGTEFDGVVSMAAHLVHAGSTVVPLASASIGNSTGYEDLTLTTYFEEVAEGRLFMVVRVNVASGGSGGALTIYNVAAKFREPLPTL